MYKYLPVVLLMTPGLALAEHPKSFGSAKKILKEIYADNQQSFYCGCDYKAQGKKLVPDLKSCGYTPRKNANRAKRIEWEHVMPAWAFGHQLQCWQDGGRKTCKKNPNFKKMESDLHNLVPAIGEVNGDRSNYSFAQLEGEPRVYGQCDMEVDFKQRKVEPVEHRRGDIARTYFYMRDQYGVRIGNKQEKLFNAWAKLDPVDQWELERNRMITQIQGNTNPYVVAPTGSVKLAESTTDQNSLLSRLKTALSMD
ncbi:endonuclease [Neptuniibacter sp. QD37_6]|uniref:endonuclease n=1 Tax=Neptuniibacter sp. QD37_6 TaxID=3398210 RepID=UPI0039F4AE19